MSYRKKRTMTVILTVAVMMLMTAAVAVPLFSNDSSADSTDDAWQFPLVGDYETPTNGDEMHLKWMTNVKELSGVNFGWAAVPGVPVFVGNSIYVRINAVIYELDMETGEELHSVASSNSGTNMYGHVVDYADYGDGIILDARNMNAFNLDLEPIYSFPASHLKMPYYDGYLYGIDKAGVSKYNPADTDTSSGTEVKTHEWRTAVTWGHTTDPMYPVFVGGFMYIINLTSSNVASLLAVDLSDGSIVDTYTFEEAGINANPTYMDGKVYVSTYYASGTVNPSDMGAVYSIPVTVTGEFDDANIKSLDLTVRTNNSSLVPYENGFGYVWTTAALHVIDLETFTEVTSLFGNYGSNTRGGISIATGYYADTGKVYIYKIPYGNTQTIVIYEHTFDSSKPVGSQHTLTGVEYSIPVTKQYNTETVRFGNNGEMVWHNDSGDLFCFVLERTVTFETDNGSSATTEQVENGKFVAKPTVDPTKANYVFSGWYSDAGCTTLYNFNKPVTANITVYAGWELPEEYWFFIQTTEWAKWISAEGTAPDEAFRAACTANGIIFTLGSSGYISSFMGYDMSGEMGFEDEDDVLSMYFLVYNLFNLENDGNWKYSDDILKNLPGNYFALVFGKAVFLPPTYYEMTSYGLPGAVIGADGLPYDMPGYVFGGYFTDAECTIPYTFTNGPTADVDLYVSWLKVLTISFHTGDGSVVENAMVVEGQKIAEPAIPTKVGHAFVGWHIDAAHSAVHDFNTPVTTGTTLYAKWVVVYSVVFNTDGGSTVVTQIVHDGNKVAGPAAPAKEGFVFDGWFADEDCTVAYDFDAIVSADTNIYAKWTVAEPDEDEKDMTAYYVVIIAVIAVIAVACIFVNRK